MVEKSDVAAVLELIRPSLQADGGAVQLVDVSDDGVVTAELQGACKGLSLIHIYKELAKLQTNLNGIRNMKKVPDAIFVIDTNRERCV